MFLSSSPVSLRVGVETPSHMEPAIRSGNLDFLQSQGGLASTVEHRPARFFIEQSQVKVIDSGGQGRDRQDMFIQYPFILQPGRGGSLIVLGRAGVFDNGEAGPGIEQLKQNLIILLDVRLGRPM